MAFDPVTGKWKPEDDSVSGKLTGLMAADNPLMTAARTNAKQAANRRGLLNSSMAVQAGEQAVLQTALPIASQEATQTHQKNLSVMDQSSKEDIARMNVAAHDRQYAISAVAEMEKKYGAMFNDIMKNNDLPAAARNSYYNHIAALRDSDMNLVEQIYGINLDWPSAVATHAT